MNNIINIASTSDENYARGLIMMVASFLRSNRNLEADQVIFHLLDGGLSEQSKQTLEGYCNHPKLKWKLEMRFIPADVSLFDAVPKLWGKSNLTLARLFLADIIQDDYAYWIDSDIIVNTKLPSYNLLDRNVIGACVEPYLPELKLDFPEESYPFGLTPKDKPYINAGFMIIDLKQWRELDFGAIATKAITENPKTFTWLDQSAINFFLADHIKIIDPKYNRNMYRSDLNIEVSQNFVDSNIHLTGQIKPWFIKETPTEYFVQNEIFLRMENKLIHRDNTAVIDLLTEKSISPLKVYPHILFNRKLYKKRLLSLKHGKRFDEIKKAVATGIKDYVL